MILPILLAACQAPQDPNQIEETKVKKEIKTTEEQLETVKSGEKTFVTYFCNETSEESFRANCEVPMREWRFGTVEKYLENVDCNLSSSRFSGSSVSVLYCEGTKK